MSVYYLPLIGFLAGMLIVSLGGGGGAVYGTLVDCVISNNTAEMGGGSWGGVRVNCAFRNNTANGEGGAMYYGTAENCTFSNNTAQYGGAWSYTKANRCMVFGNTAYLGGAGYYATASNCVFTANAASGGGGVSWYGTYGHCTFYSNQAECGGAMYRGTASNCIFFGNSADYADDTYQANVSYSLARGIIGNQGDGTGVVSGDPLFVNAASGDFRLDDASPCVNAGNPDYASFGTDFAGNPRVRDGRTDMGAFEADIPGISGVYAAVPEGGLLRPLGNTVLRDGESATYHAVGPRPFLGFYTNGIFAAASTNITLSAQSDDILLEAKFDIATPITIYADSTQAGDADGRTPTTAFATLQEAIDAAIAGDTVEAAPGTYAPISTGNKAMEIRSSDGAAVTLIDGGNARRCATLGDSASETATRLIGFTLRNGDSQSGNGGGSRYGTLESCVIVSNTASGANAEGGGAYGGILRNCILKSNTATLGSMGIAGGGASRAILENCTISGNEGRGGGGMACCTLRDCVVESNSAAWDGGGALDCTASRCVFRGNTAGYDGGGAESGSFDNCLFIGNIAGKTGGGVGGGYWWNAANLVNCTITGNRADIAGGGICAEITDECYSYPHGPSAPCYGISLNNCIVWDNSLSDGTADNVATVHANGNAAENPGEGILSRNSCSFPLLAGTGNLASSPDFVSPGDGDYRLADTSPCVDTGTLMSAMSEIWNYWDGEGDDYCICEVEEVAIAENAVDFDGNPRILFYGIDMGCFERTTAVSRNLTFGDVWGSWSSESAEHLSMPETAASWEEFARALWNARDAFFRSGTATEVPPSTNAIVLSVGAISVPDSMFDLDGVEWRTVAENGIAVCRAHLRESDGTGNLVLVLPDGETEVSRLPSYLADEWIASVYGGAPSWLTGTELDDWKAARARSRIEWMATLVPQSQWAQYVAAREEGVAATEADSESGDVFVLSGMEAATGDGAHSVSVLSSSGGIVRLLGKESLSDSRWDYKGLSMQERGGTAAGAVSEAPSQFFMATRQSSSGTGSAASIGDSDGDGIPDDVERLVFGTDPGNADTSGEGMSDWEKAYRLGLDPAVRDTAGDGISDAEKIASGNDPRVAASPARISAASRSIRYTYDDDDRLTGTWFGLGGASTETALTPAGNPEDIRDRSAAR